MSFTVIEFEKMSRPDWESIQLLANSFSPIGVIENELEESQIDELFGEKALTSSFESEWLVDQLENRDEIYNARIIFDEDTAHLDQFLSEIVSIVGSNFRLKHLEDQDWDNDWKKHYARISIPGLLDIVPEWERTINSDSESKEVYIRPGQGFGTGTHETTRMCLEYLYNVNSSSSTSLKILDFGCGSGILGIAAKKIATDSVIDFVDIDQDALENCSYNIGLNFTELSWSKLFLRSEFESDKKYDVVFANILLNTLIEEKQLVKSSLAENGYLIVSGLLKEQVPEFLEKFELENLVLVNSREMGDWASLIIKN